MTDARGIVHSGDVNGMVSGRRRRAVCTAIGMALVVLAVLLMAALALVAPDRGRG